MTCTFVQNGSAIAAELRDSSENSASSPIAPRTLADLLAIWSENPPRQVSMLRHTCALLADYHGTTVHDLTIDAVEQRRKSFRAFLEGRKNKENSIRTYVNYVRILLNLAREAGWELSDTTSTDWRCVIALADEQHCGDLARSLASIRKSPRDVTFEDVDCWVHEMAKQRLAYGTALSRRKSFWRIVRDCGFAKKLPPCILREENYGIPVEKFPAGLKQEVLDLLKWKQDDYVWDRPKGARIRAVTAKRLEQVLCALYGYYVNVLGDVGIGSLSQMAQPHLIGGFCQWCHSRRAVKGQTLQRNLRLFNAALHQHPRYKDLKLDWFKSLLDGLPVEPDSVLKRRRAEKVLDYSVIEAIPDMVRAQRTKAAKKGSKDVARLAMVELLIRWLSILPWRQRNIRECRLSGGSHPNLYKGRVPAITTIDMPAWAIEERQKDPNADFWQFYFNEDETKTGCEVHALLPHQLIGPLEEYLDEFRQDLVVGDDPGTLFLNQAGNPMSLNQVTQVVSANTLTFGGRRVTPHPFRDVVSVAWLKDHPKDYMGLSKLLWHANPNQVIKTYGSLFNESSGVCMMESWLDERAAKRHP